MPRKLSYQDLGFEPYLQQDVKVLPIPTPTGGWNNIIPISEMDPQTAGGSYAPLLQNWVPRPGFVEIRPGYSAWAQGLSTSVVESLMTYRPAGNERLFAATNGSIYDVTIQGIPAQVQSSLGSNRWQYINFTPALGLNYLYIVNGVDNPRYWDGTAWTQPSITGGPGPSSFINIFSWKRRIWFVQNNSQVAWYLGTDSISGALAGSLDLGSIVKDGGHLVAIGKITQSGGDTPDSDIVFIMSRGDCVVYRGTDPTSASTFSLQGTFKLPPPLGTRCTSEIGADMAIITLQGVIPFSQSWPIDQSSIRQVALTNKIQTAMSQSATAAQSNFGWELAHYPAQDLIILNVPVTQGSGQQQYIMNTLTGAWAQFTGWNANCFALFNDQLFFGDNKGNVNLAWSGGADLTQPIVSDMQCAFNYFGDRGRIKQITMIQPILITSGVLTPSLGVDVDFGSISPSAPVQTANPTGAQFGSAIFGTSIFAAGISTQTLWQGVRAEGKALAVRMKVNLLPPGSGGQSVFDTGTFDTMVFDGLGIATNTVQVNSFNAMVKYGGSI